MKYLILFFVGLGAALAQEEACLGTPLELDATDVPVGFFSPGFNYSNPDGSFYGEEITCEYLITTASADPMQLSFFNFSVEGCSDCACDSVKVYDGPDDTFPEVKNLCGSLGDVVPEPFVSSGNALFVRFNTNDYATDDRGFFGRVGYIFDNSACDVDRPALITDPRPGFLSTENYPVNYVNNEICSWQFQAPVGQRPQVIFYDFQVEDCCNCDFLEVFNGPSGGSPLQGRFYGNDLPAVITGSSNEMFMQFESDFSVTFPGFFAFYRFI